MELLATTLVTYFLEKGFDKLFNNKEDFEKELLKIINDACEEYKGSYPQENIEQKYPFYESQKIIDELLKYRVMHQGDYNYQMLLDAFDAEAKILPPTKEQIKNYYAIFMQKINSHEKLKQLEIAQTYPDEIFRISGKIDFLCDVLLKRKDEKNNNSNNLFLEISRKQLSEWKIKCGKLFNMLNDDADYIPMKLRGSKKEYCADNFLTDLRVEEYPHVILTGDVGMGKTTTCMRLWETYLNQNKHVFYMPLCDYDSTKATIKKNIVEIYSVKDDYERLMYEEDIILLLDGFNEMKSEHNNDFFQELKKIVSKKNIQIVITSRNNVDDIETSTFSRITFMPIAPDTIKEWLKSKGYESPISTELLGILSNPMLLKIHSININEKEPIIIKNREKAELLDKPITIGEIIWNFLEYQIIKSTYLKTENEGFSKILYRYLLPYIAYQIESKGDFHFSLSDLRKYIDEFNVFFVQNIYKFESFTDYQKSIDIFLNDSYRTQTLLKLCEENLCIIKLQTTSGIEEKRYSFIHQYFRDIFSATHIRNQMILNDKKVFNERILPFNILRMLSEILQEHKYVPIKLRDYLKNFKNGKGEQAQRAVFNCLQIIDYARNGDMSDEDFSELDLRMCSLVGKNCIGVNFSKSYVSQNLFFGSNCGSSAIRLDYNSNDNLIASASDDVIEIWDSKTGNYIRSIGGLSGSVLDVCFCPNSKLILSAHGSDYTENTIKIWNYETGNLVLTLYGHESFIRSAKFSSDGKYIVSASDDKTVRIWDSLNGNLIHPIKSYSAKINCINFSPDGTHIVSASDDKTIKVWIRKTGVLLYTLEGHTGEVNSANYSRDGKFIVSASIDSTIKIWESGTGKLIRVIKADLGNVSSANFSFSGEFIVSAFSDGSIGIWKSETGELVRLFKGHKSLVFHAIFSSDGSNVFSSSLDGTIKIWDSQTGRLICTTGKHSNNINSARFSPNGKYVVSASDDSTIKIWDVNTGILCNILDGHADMVTSANYSHNGEVIVSSSTDKSIKTWKSDTGDLIRSFKGHTDSVISAIFSFDDKYIISSSFDDAVKIWDSSSGDLTPIINSKTDYCEYNASFSPDGKSIVSISENIGGKAIIIRNSETGKIVQILGKNTDNISCVRYSHDSKFIVAAVTENMFCNDNGDIYPNIANNNIKIWECKTGRLLQVLTAHTDFVNSVCFSPDDKYILSVSDDCTIKVWKKKNALFKLFKSIKCRSHWSSDASYSSDGKSIVSVYNDETIKIWKSDLRQLICTIRPMTTKILKSDIRDIKTDNLTEDDIEILRQNGACVV